MKQIETAEGQLFEIWTSRTEALHDITTIIDDIRYALEHPENPYMVIDDSVWIQYKDGSHYYIGDQGEEGKFRKTGISCIIDENSATTMLYGDFVIYNIDNMDELYSPEVDETWKFWNADPA